jgi:tetratricopeptide (TPR) repeat protein
VKHFRRNIPKDIISYKLIKKAEFIAQSSKDDCGPSALSMLLSTYDPQINYDEVKKQVYSPKAEGSFPQDILSSIRRHKYLALKIEDQEMLFRSLEKEHPVIVFLNMGSHRLPMWHYALVVGYDLYDEVFFLHSADKAYKKISFENFNYHWTLADRWAYTARNPESMDTHFSINSYLKEIEANKNFDFSDRYSYYSELRKIYPESVYPIIGMAQAAAQAEHWDKSINLYKQALEKNSPHKEQLKKSILWVSKKKTN